MNAGLQVRLPSMICFYSRDFEFWILDDVRNCLVGECMVIADAFWVVVHALTSG